MAENPESIIALVGKNNSGNDDAVEAMRRQIHAHENANLNKSALDKVVQTVWHQDDKTLEDLRALQAKVNLDIQRGNKAPGAGHETEIAAAVKADQNAMIGQNEVEFYAGSFMKAVPLFAGRSRVLMATSIGVNALDAVKMKDSGGEVVADLALGGFKGFALKKTFDTIGAKQFAIGAEGTMLNQASSIAGIGGKGIIIGGASRLYETGLHRENWVNAKGEVDPMQAVSMATRAAVDGRSMALDAGLFIGAHGIFTGLSRVGTKAIEASPFLQKVESSTAGQFVKDAKLIPSATMGATFGFSSGVVGEVTREHQAGEGFDLGKILKRGGLQALTDAAAGATGAGATRMSQFSQFSNAEAPAVGTRKDGLAFAGENTPVGPEVPGAASKPGAEVKAGERVEAGEKVEPPAVIPERTAVVPDKVEVTADKPEVVPEKVEAPPERLEPGVQEHKMDEALAPIFQKSVDLARTAVETGATAEDVIGFFKHTAVDGQHVKTQMDGVAKQATDFGNTAMEALIKHANETPPEVAATLDRGLTLAQTAAKPNATPEEHLAFLEYAYGEGKGAEAPLRIAAELSGENKMDAIIQEAYAGANGLQRNPDSYTRISLDAVPAPAADLLRTILGNLPDNAQSHQLFRQNLHQWLDIVPQHANVVKDFAHQTRHGIVAAVVDAKLGTDYMSQFPNRNLTSGNLLDKLRGFEHSRAAETSPLETVTEPGTETIAAQIPEVQAPAKPNPYEPAIDHQPGRKVVNPERLIEEFNQSEGRAKLARAYLLSDFISSMSDKQFADWYQYGMQSSGRADGSTNFQVMRMPGLEVLSRPEVHAAITDPANAAIDMKTLKDFLSAPVKSTEMPPEWQTDFIADRVELATQRLAMTELPEGAEAQPIDPSKVVKDAVPSWFLKSIRERYSTYDRNTGQATYPVEFNDHLAQMLENQRYLERQNPKYRESTPPSNSFNDRIALLEKALDAQKSSAAPDVVPQLLKLGATDQPALRGILDKLNFETNAVEYTELLTIVVPRAENIGEVKTLLDAMYFGKKSDSNAFKARKDGKNADYAEKDRDANMALALTVAQKLAPSSEPDGQRLQQIVTGVITGKIRDPRPPMDGPGGPGGPDRGGPGGRRNGGGDGGGREFRQRPNPARDDTRPANVEQKPVAADNVTVEQILQQAGETAGSGAVNDVVAPQVVVGEAALAKLKTGTVVETGEPVAQPEPIQTPTIHEFVPHQEPVRETGVVGGSQRPDFIAEDTHTNRGGRRRGQEEFDDDGDGASDRRRQSKPRGQKRERGGANSGRWQRGFGDDE